MPRALTSFFLIGRESKTWVTGINPVMTTF